MFDLNVLLFLRLLRRRLVHAVATVFAVCHQTYLVLMRLGSFLSCMLPWIVGSVDPDRVAARFMLSGVLVLVLAKQVVAVTIPVRDVQEPAGAHRIQL